MMLTWPYFFLMMDLRLWYTSAPARSASENVLQPVGRIMNSCAAVYGSICHAPSREALLTMRCYMQYALFPAMPCQASSAFG